MKICYFGIYNKDYSRNRIIIDGLKKNGVDIIECKSDKKGIFKYVELMSKYKNTEKHDFIIIGFPGFQCVILARMISRKKIFFDMFAPLYESMIEDRKKTAFGFYYWLLDFLSIKVSNFVFLDTEEHINYVSKKYFTQRNKFIKILVGCDKNFFFRDKNIKKDDFVVHFHGSGIPLHGINKILGVAKDNENIMFNIYGTRIKNENKENNAKNIFFYETSSSEKINEAINKTNICLGVFGNTRKTDRVIPNKIYEYISCGCPVITKDTPAMRELFEDQKNIFFSSDLSKNIKELIDDSVLREKIGDNGLDLSYNLTSEKVVKPILEKFKIYDN